MKHMIRPAEEEIGSVVPVILFSLLWYSSIFGIIFRRIPDAPADLSRGRHTAAVSGHYKYPPRLLLP